MHVVGWSLGGIFSLLAAAADPDLPIASLTVVGSPVDVSLVPLVAPLRPLLDWADGRGPVTRGYQALGGAPQPLVRWAFQLVSFQKLVTKPVAMATHLDDAEFLAQIEAVDRFTAGMIAYPGRTFGQLYHRFVKGNALVKGTFELDDRTIDARRHRRARPGLRRRHRRHRPRRLRSRPSCRCSPARPRCASRSSRAATSACSPVGPRARTTWAVLDEWISQWSDRRGDDDTDGG